MTGHCDSMGAACKGYVSHQAERRRHELHEARERS